MWSLDERDGLHAFDLICQDRLQIRQPPSSANPLKGKLTHATSQYRERASCLYLYLHTHDLNLLGRSIGRSWWLQGASLGRRSTSSQRSATFQARLSHRRSPTARTALRTRALGTSTGLISRCEKGRLFLRHLYIKCIVLPRQARDKHRESTQKRDVFSQHVFAGYTDIRGLRSVRMRTRRCSFHVSFPRHGLSSCLS